MIFLYLKLTLIEVIILEAYKLLRMPILNKRNYTSLYKIRVKNQPLKYTI